MTTKKQHSNGREVQACPICDQARMGRAVKGWDRHQVLCPRCRATAVAVLRHLTAELADETAA